MSTSSTPSKVDAAFPRSAGKMAETMPTAAPLSPTALDLIHLGPEVVLSFWGLLVLVVDFAGLRHLASDRRAKTLGTVTLVGVLLALVAAFLPEFVAKAEGAPREPSLFLGTIAGGPLVERLNAVTLILLGLVVAVSASWAFTENWGEYYALTLWGGVGMMLLMASEELLTLFLSLEMMTICFYLLAAFEKGRPRSPEAGLKYFVYGSVSSALFLFGLSLLYGLTGTTRLAGIGVALSGQGGATVGLGGNLAGATAVLLVLVGFGFKIAAAPFHQWAPDVYEGAPAPVSAWIASGSKLASVAALMKVLIQALGPYANGPDGLTGPGYVGIVAVLAAVSMTYGNFAALAQKNLKRMLAYSSIAHAGYLLVGVLAAAVSVDPAASSGSVLFYLAVYAFTTLGAFAVASWLIRDGGSDDIDDLDGLGSRSPALAACIVLLMLSLIGLPPLAGFFGKLFMFMEALNAAPRYRLTFLWLVILGLFNSVISAFYYARVLRALFLRPARAQANRSPAPSPIAATIIFATIVAIGCGVYAHPLAQDAVAVARSRLFVTGGKMPLDNVQGKVGRPLPPEPTPPSRLVEKIQAD